MDRDETLIRKVLSNYSFHIKDIKLLTVRSHGNKVVWEVQTDSGDFILKLVNMNEEQVRFMIYVIHYLEKKGFRTPPVIRTSKGKEFVKADGKCYIVFKKIVGKTLKYCYKSGDLKVMAKELATLHKMTKGIRFPKNIKKVNTLWNTREEFHTQYARLQQLQDSIPAVHKETGFHKSIPEHIRFCMERCKKTIQLLNVPSYEAWVKETDSHPVLVHRDYLRQNLRKTGDGKLIIFDMDGFSIDLPIEDLRVTIGRIMEKITTWDDKLLVHFLDAYQKVNPLTKKQLRFLFAYLWYPGNLCKEILKQHHFQNWPEQYLKDVISMEEKKAKVLTNVFKHKLKCI